MIYKDAEGNRITLGDKIFFEGFAGYNGSMEEKPGPKISGKIIVKYRNILTFKPDSKSKRYYGYENLKRLESLLEDYCVYKESEGE